MLVLCQLGETWCATLSSLAISTPVAPTTSASQTMAFFWNGYFRICHSSEPIVLTAVPRLSPKLFDGVAEGASGRVVPAVAEEVAALASSGISSAGAVDYDAGSTSQRRPAQPDWRMRGRKTMLTRAEDLCR
jgi:hypothetical protein